MSSASGSKQLVTWQRLGYCWLGGTRFTTPLGPADENKWRALDSLQVGMYVVGFADGGGPRRWEQHACFYRLPRSRLAPVRHLTFLLGGTLLASWLVLRGKVRVLITQSPFEGFAGSVVKAFAPILGHGIVLIVESHGDFTWSSATHAQRGPRRAYRALLLAAARAALRSADLFRAVSYSTRNQLQEWARGQPTVIIPGWTDRQPFETLRREMPLADCHDLLFAGSLAPVKGLDVLLQAFAHIAEAHREARLWIVGRPTNPRYLDRLKWSVTDLGLDSQVIFEDALSPSDLAARMGCMRGVVLPSLAEGLGRVLVESMLCGTPVIATDVGGIPEIVHDQENGLLVPPGDVQCLGAAMARLLSDTDIEAMGNRARAYARDLLLPRAYIEGHRQLFMQAAAILAPK